MIEVKNITEPQTIYIFGSDFDGKTQSFSTTDDYDTVDLYKDGKRLDMMDISGVCFIYTEEEYQENKELIDENSAGGVDVVILEDFVGKISVDIRYTDFDFKSSISTIGSESLLKPNTDPIEYLKYETIDQENENPDYPFDCILFIDGTYTKYEKHTVEEFLEL
jgi:hypothetical protein